MTKSNRPAQDTKTTSLQGGEQVRHVLAEGTKLCVPLKESSCSADLHLEQ